MYLIKNCKQIFYNILFNIKTRSNARYARRNEHSQSTFAEWWQLGVLKHLEPMANKIKEEELYFEYNVRKWENNLIRKI